MATTSCRCSQCYGLREYMLQLTGKDYGLPKAKGCNGAWVAFVVHGCDGSMTCSCSRCEQERAERVRTAGLRTVKQPWDLAA